MPKLTHLSLGFQDREFGAQMTRTCYLDKILAAEKFETICEEKVVELEELVAHARVAANKVRCLSCFQ